MQRFFATSITSKETLLKGLENPGTEGFVLMYHRSDRVVVDNARLTEYRAKVVNPAEVRKAYGYEKLLDDEPSLSARMG